MNLLYIISLILSLISIVSIVVVVLITIKTKKEIKNYIEQINSYKNKVDNYQNDFVKLNDCSTKVEQIENNLEILNDAYKTNLEIQEKNTEILQNKQIQLEEKISLISNELENQQEEIFESSFPIGSYFITSSSEFNPAEAFGGKWELIKDRFIVGAGNKYKTNTVGGEEKHTLTIDEMPSHKHKASWRGGVFGFGGDVTTTGPAEGRGYRSQLGDEDGSTVGGNKAHNNIPPYIAAYLWHRVG